MTHPINAVYVDGSGNKPAKATVRTYMQARVPLVLGSAAEIQSLNVGATTAVVLLGRTYFYDATDTVSAHDGINVLVDSTGRRFKLQAALQVHSGVWRITDKDLSAPPGSPVDGAAYIVAAGASGDWAGQSGKIAIRVAGTWVFSTPLQGAIAYLIDETTYYHHNGTAWSAGLPGQLAAASVHLSHMLQGVTLLAIESTANAPAGGESNGAAYIVGASPSGSFAAMAAKSIAILEAGAWVAYAPAEGWRVDDKSSGRMLRYSGADWLDGSGSGKLLGYSVDATTLAAPSASTWTEIASHAVAIANAGNKLLLRVDVRVSSGTLDGGLAVRFRRDSEGTPLKTGPTGLVQGAALTHLLAPADTVSHTYRAEIFFTSTGSLDFVADLHTQELAP